MKMPNYLLIKQEDVCISRGDCMYLYIFLFFVLFGLNNEVGKICFEAVGSDCISTNILLENHGSTYHETPWKALTD